MAGDRNKKSSTAADNVEELPPGGTTGKALQGIMALLQTMQQQQQKQQEAMQLQQKQQQQITEQLLRKLSLAPAATNPDGQAEGVEHASLPVTKVSQSGGNGDSQSGAAPALHSHLGQNGCLHMTGCDSTTLILWGQMRQSCHLTRTTTLS